MNRKSFLLSLPLIGLAVKAFSKSEEYPNVLPDYKESSLYYFNDNGKAKTLKKGERGRWIACDPYTGEEKAGCFLWNDETKTGVKFVPENNIYEPSR